MEERKKIEQTIESRDAAEMLGKEHKELLRDIRRYEKQFIESKIALNEFFQASNYKDSIGRTLPCYRITKKGCEFIAHKLTGTKGTAFTARYINRFHEMEDIIAEKRETELPWFIKKFRGEYIILWRDFAELTGIDIDKQKPRGWTDYVRGGMDFNGWGWRCDNETFKTEYGFDYGEDDCMMFFFPHGVRKVLQLIHEDSKLKISCEAEAELMAGIELARKLPVEFVGGKVAYKYNQRKRMINNMIEMELRKQEAEQLEAAGQQAQIEVKQEAPAKINITINGVELCIESNGSVPMISVK